MFASSLAFAVSTAILTSVTAASLTTKHVSAGWPFMISKRRRIQGCTPLAKAPCNPTTLDDLNLWSAATPGAARVKRYMNASKAAAISDGTMSRARRVSLRRAAQDSDFAVFDVKAPSLADGMVPALVCLHVPPPHRSWRPPL